jgi:hypothetical protein
VAVGIALAVAWNLVGTTRTPANPPQPALSPGAEVAEEQAAASAWAKATPTVTPAWSAAPGLRADRRKVSDRFKDHGHPATLPRHGTGVGKAVKTLTS